MAADQGAPQRPVRPRRVLTKADRDQILCDCNIARIILGPDSQPLDVGREQRTVPRWMRHAIASVIGAVASRAVTAGPATGTTYTIHKPDGSRLNQCPQRSTGPP